MDAGRRKCSWSLIRTARGRCCRLWLNEALNGQSTLSLVPPGSGNDCLLPPAAAARKKPNQR